MVLTGSLSKMCTSVQPVVQQELLDKMSVLISSNMNEVFREIIWCSFSVESLRGKKMMPRVVFAK